MQNFIEGNYLNSMNMKQEFSKSELDILAGRVSNYLLPKLEDMVSSIKNDLRCLVNQPFMQDADIRDAHSCLNLLLSGQNSIESVNNKLESLGKM